MKPFARDLNLDIQPYPLTYGREANRTTPDAAMVSRELQGITMDVDRVNKVPDHDTLLLIVKPEP